MVMNRRCVKAEKINNMVRLTWVGESEEIATVEVFFTRGALVWPRGIMPGIIILAGQDLQDKIEIYEEIEFRTISLAGEIINDLITRFIPDYFFYKDPAVDWGFLRELAKVLDGKDRWKLAVSPFCNDFDYGNEAIEDFLKNDRLIIPKGGIIHKQIESHWKGMVLQENQFHGIEALRYLLTGVRVKPGKLDKIGKKRRWPPELTEIATRDIEESFKGASEEDGYLFY
jgi:hypothetical protein